MYRMFNQRQERPEGPLLIQTRPSNNFLNLIIPARTADDRLIPQALFSPLTANPQMLIQLLRDLSCAQRAVFSRAGRLSTPGARNLTAANSAHFIDAARQQTTSGSTPNSGLNAETLDDQGIDIPQEYCCPLSLSIMTDPVYLLNDPTGTRFEREWITRWLNEHGSHPTTRGEYLPGTLRADIDLKARIDGFTQSAEEVTTSRPGK